MSEATSTPETEWETRYHRLRIVVDNAVPVLEEHAHLLEITSRRLAMTGINCAITARGIRDIASVLHEEAHRA